MGVEGGRGQREGAEPAVEVGAAAVVVLFLF